MTPPETMRAWRVTRNGEPEDVLALQTTEVPRPGPGEVLVRTGAVALNFPDVLLCRGEYQVRPEIPFTVGIELCGQVVAVGEDVERFAVGERIVGSQIGVLSEYAVLPAQSVHAAPPALTDIAAAGLTVAYHTAWFGLHRRGRLAAGETLLVHAAAGGVGAAAVQLGKAAGARVIGVVGDERKAQVASAAGADVVLRRGEEDIVARVKEVTGGRGVDVVFDPVGGAAFEQSTKVIAFEGRIVVVGFASGTIPLAKTNHALVKNYSIDGLHWGLYQATRPDLVDECHAAILGLCDAGLIAPVVDEVVAMTDAAAGITRLGEGATVGRIVVDVAGDAA